MSRPAFIFWGHLRIYFSTVPAVKQLRTASAFLCGCTFVVLGLDQLVSVGIFICLLLQFGLFVLV